MSLVLRAVTRAIHPRVAQDASKDSFSVMISVFKTALKTLSATRLRSNVRAAKPDVPFVVTQTAASLVRKDSTWIPLILRANPVRPTATRACHAHGA